MGFRSVLAASAAFALTTQFATTPVIAEDAKTRSVDVVSVDCANDTALFRNFREAQATAIMTDLQGREHITIQDVEVLPDDVSLDRAAIGQLAVISEEGPVREAYQDALDQLKACPA